MDKVDKALLKLPDKRRKKILKAFALVVRGETKGLQIKKLKGHTDLYRLRVGNDRLVYRVFSDKKPETIFIGKRDDQTYHDF